MMLCSDCGGRNLSIVEEKSALVVTCLRPRCGARWTEAKPVSWADGLENPVRRQLDYGEFERQIQAQAPDVHSNEEGGNPSGVMRPDDTDRGQSKDSMVERMASSTACSECDGTGRDLDGTTCHECRGYGRRHEESL